MTSGEIISEVDKYVLGTYKRTPLVITRGEGCWVWDNKDRKLLDFTTGIAVTCLGHSHPALLGAIDLQSRKIVHGSNLFYLEPQARLARNLVENSACDKVFFCNTGTEAVEGAIKFARKWGSLNGKKHKIVSMHGSFHGRTYGALSATGAKQYQLGFEPMLEGFEFVPYGESEPLRRCLKEGGFCAVIVEPVQGENGVIVPQRGYLRKVREICDQSGALLILDEIQTGMGRTGKLFAHEHEEIEPDIIAVAKALGGGVPCGAVLLRDAVADTITPGSHGTTFGGNPLAVSCALAVLETINDKKLLESVSSMGSYFLKKLRRIQDEHCGIIKDARGMGLMIGLEFVSSEAAEKVIAKCALNGLLTIHTAGTVMRILPPLTVSEKEIDIATAIIESSIKEVLSNG